MSELTGYIITGNNIATKKPARFYTDANIGNGSSSGSEGGNVEVVDSLTSTSATKALSANQGKVLNTKLALLSKTLQDSTNTFIITSDKYELELSTEKGTGIFNPACYYSNITITDSSVKLVEGGLYIFVPSTEKSVPNANYRNVRIRFGESGDYKPLLTADGRAITGSNVIITGTTFILIYRSNKVTTGGFHTLYDSNTTYATISENDLAENNTSARSITAEFLNSKVINKISNLETKINEIYEDYLEADSLI